MGILAPCLLHASGSPDIIWQQSLNSDRINSVTFTPDGSELISGSSDRLINFWQASDGTLLKVLDSNAPDIHPSSVECVAINPAGDLLATCNSNAEKFWHLPAGTETVLSQVPNNWVVWCAFSADGKYMATASFNTQIRLWQVSDNTLVRTFPSADQQRTVAFSPDGKWLASAGGDDVVTIRSTANWEVVTQLVGHTDTIYDMAFSPDSTMIATGAYDNTAKIWNVADWSLRSTSGGNVGAIYAVAFSPDSSVLAYCDSDGNTLKLVDTSNGNIFQTYDQNVDAVQCLAFSPQGTLAYGNVNRTVYVANVLSASSHGPTVSLTSPAGGSTFSAPATVTLTASASSSQGVAQVTYYDQDNNNLGSASSAPYTVTWNNVAAGNYTVTAVMQDDSGATATSSAVSFSVGSGSGSGTPPPANTSLTVSTHGSGTILPKRGAQILVSGKKYLIEAVPAAGYVFDGWTDGNGNSVTNAADFYFTMQAGLTLQANFIQNPFIPVDGRYYGLIESSPATAEGAGKISFTVASSGAFSAAFYYGGVYYTFSGRFTPEGAFTYNLPRRGNTALAITLNLDVAGGSEQITGAISDGTVTSAVSADRLTWNARTNPAPSGRYTILIQPNAGDTTTPQGYGWAVATINTAGTVAVSGRLADGTLISESTILSKNSQWPFYVLATATHESASGEITLEANDSSDMDGTVNWFRGAITHAAYFPNGFNTQVALVGSRYNLPAPGDLALNIPAGTDNAQVTLGAADYPAPANFQGTLNNKFQFIADKPTGSPKGFAMTLNRANGVISGSFIDPNSNRAVTYAGVLYQKSNIGAGYFLSGGQSGFIQLESSAPAP